MSNMATAPAPSPRAVSNAWVGFVGFSFLAFLIGAAVQFGLMALLDRVYGACVQSMGPCPPGSQYTPWQTVVVTVPTYLIWITPALLAARRGKQLAAHGARGGRALLAASLVVIALVTVAAFLMWWIPGI